ncbi:MAG: hypothetical protein ACK44P_03115, partial [Bacteroidota bacterium]
LTQTTQFRAVVQSGTCPEANSSTTTVTVTPATAGGSVSGGTTICSGATSGTLTLSGNTGNVVRWESSVAPFNSWTSISNTTTAHTSGALTQTTAFRAIVQSGTCASANSDSSIVVVLNQVSKGSVSGTTNICTGSTSNLTLSGHTGSIIRWESSVAPFTSWTVISNTSSNYTSGVLSQTNAFRAVVGNGSCSNVNSDSFVVVVAPQTVGGLTIGGTSICTGSGSAPLSVVGRTGRIIRWERSVSPFTTWIVINDTSSTYSSGPLTVTTAFRAVVQSGNCSAKNADSTIVTVSSGVIGGAINGAAPICSGSAAAQLSVTGLIGTIQGWQSSVAPFTVWTPISNTTSIHNPGILTQTTQFRVVVSSGTCPSGTLTPVSISVSPTSAGGSVSGGTSICTGSTSGTLTLSGNTGNVVRWESAVAPFTTWTSISNTTTTHTSGALTQTTQFRAVVQSG